MKRVLLFLALCAVALAGPVPPASAHEGAARLEIAETTATAPDTGRFVVRLAYIADGHPVDGATVTAVPEGPAGGLTPQTMAAVADQEGVYETTIRFPEPGTWTVRFTAVAPQAVLTTTFEAAPLPTTTTSEAPTTSTTEAATSTTEADPVPVAAASDDDDSGLGAGVVVLLVVLVAAVAAGTYLGVRRGRDRRDERRS